MATGQGTATLDFSTGLNEAQVAVTGQASILGSSKAEAYIMGDDTSSGHTASDHRYVGLWLALTCGTPTVGVGFTIYGRSSEELEGTYTVRYVWAD